MRVFFRVFRMFFHEFRRPILILNTRKYNIETPAKVLTIHGDRDEVVNVENAELFDEVIKNHILHVIPEANHNFNGFRFVNEVVDKIKEVMTYDSIKLDRGRDEGKLCSHGSKSLPES